MQFALTIREIFAVTCYMLLLVKWAIGVSIDSKGCHNCADGQVVYDLLQLLTSNVHVYSKHCNFSTTQHTKAIIAVSK